MTAFKLMRASRKGFQMIRSFKIDSVRLFSIKVGPKLDNLEDVKNSFAYPTWDIKQYIASGEDIERQKPSEEVITKLLKLSGLPLQNLDEFREKLGEQLAFLNKLHGVEVEEDVDASHARLVERCTEPIGFGSLVQKLEVEQKKDVNLGEISGSWNCVGNADIEKDGFFVLRNESAKNSG
ncbi:LAMI_0H05446g1_1 [Lachancea mirantina]|uniref:Glutamyl-tRNA(Gln) amidotransferase subunit F, mitochondrial n=1 Tax=Lachancea mirantina TaxID=1230905 RepID=A0A1G4KF29_9SACH|nr:LAMI_0H05446g1_1 [Lachancea mirantina]